MATHIEVHVDKDSTNEHTHTQAPTNHQRFMIGSSSFFNFFVRIFSPPSFAVKYTHNFSTRQLLAIFAGCMPRVAPTCSSSLVDHSY